jgi:thiamine-phosphate pyrophosphorylase
VGLELVAYAARRAPCPWFAIGGIDPSNLAGVLGGGARRVAVVRAIAAASDPVAAARALRAAIDGAPTRGTPAQPATHA